MEIRFDNQLVVVTGGAGGIGREICKQYLLSGAKVAIIDVESEHLHQVEKELSQIGIIRVYGTDLTNLVQIDNAISKIVKEMGIISVLVEAAGIMRSAPSLQINEEQWDAMFAVNSKASFFVAQSAMKHSMKDNGGSILLFSSAVAIRGFTGSMANINYAASKGSLISMARQLACEWGEFNVRVNAIVPGGVLTEAMKKMNFDNSMTDRIPLKRLCLPKEIAEAVLFFTSKNSYMITGQAIVIDGGANLIGQ